MSSRYLLNLCLACLLAGPALSQNAPTPFDAAPFGTPLAEDQGLRWEDPREIHSVQVDFAETLPTNLHLRLEYWGSHWPQQHLPKDSEPGGGNNGWLELGNWYNGGWRIADAEASISANSVHFTFRPINAHEYPQLKDYDLSGRFTLKIRIIADQPLPRIASLHAWTDSMLGERTVRIVWKQPPSDFQAEAFNGQVLSTNTPNRLSTVLRIRATENRDPNTFDRTLVTLQNGSDRFTFKVDDLKEGPLFLPEYGAAILPDTDRRDYTSVAEAVRLAGQKTLYDRVAELPEQTWESAWNGMPAKKSRICFVLGLDGARQKFRLNADGGLFIRWNDQYMKGLSGADTPRLALEKPPVQLQFGLPDKPVERHLEGESIPTCVTTWAQDGIRVIQTAFATTLNGMQSNAPPPPPDACAVAMLRFEFTNTTAAPKVARLPIVFLGGETYDRVRLDEGGVVWNGSQVRAQVLASHLPSASTNQLQWSVPLPAHESRAITIKMPYLPLTEPAEVTALMALNFDKEQMATGNYWRRILNQSARLITPEPDLDNFYRAVAGHLLINSEIEPGTSRRLARVGSFNYGTYGNESCMMVLDLDRRGYHQAAADCLESWLHYQGTAGLPGDFDSKEGVLYGAAGYEAGGYNQHHGWILWTLVEHYRFTRDEAWLRRVAPGMVAGADWIIRETGRTNRAGDLAQGLLPPGDLEDIGDWWTWLSTSCYTWRGLDSAAWALGQIHDPNAPRLRAAADAYHQHLVDQFLAASERSPVVRLRDGTAIPQIPSYVQRRGRSFGWICETLEGAMHLIITRAMDPRSVRAQWILKDYEDNLFLSNQYGYTLDDFDKYWFGRGGMSMQACLLLDVEAYLYRDDVKQALRALFNALALNQFPDVHMNTEHSLPAMGDWLGDVYKSSDEANACGWLRYLFVREDGDELLIGQAIPRSWLQPGKDCGITNTATYFGNTSIVYEGGAASITARLQGPTRNPPREIRVRFRAPDARPLTSITVNGKPWNQSTGDWVVLPGDVGTAVIVASY